MPVGWAPYPRTVSTPTAEVTEHYGRPMASSVSHPWSTALVTGASSGIGEAFCRLLSDGNTDLVLVARRVDRLEELASTLRARGVAVEVLAADLSSTAGREAVAARLSDPDAPVDLLVNCAGLGAATAFRDGDLARYREVIDVNVCAVVELSHAAVQGMGRRGRGWIINVSSLGGHAPGPGFAVYSATKAFVTSFTESLHEEFRGTGVMATAVCPGATITEFGEISGANGDDLPGLLWQEPIDVAHEGLVAAAAGKAVRVTGWPNRVAAGASALLPRAARRRLAGLVTDRL